MQLRPDPSDNPGRGTSTRTRLAPRERLLLVSAADQEALGARLEQLPAYLRGSKEDRADVAFTLVRGRRAMAHRACVILPESGDVASLADAKVLRGRATGGAGSVVFMFPGQGAQFVGMGRWLYENAPRYRETFERCERILEPKLGFPLRELLLAEPDAADPSLEQRLTLTSIAQPALFVVEYALADLLTSFGVRPALLIGHSIGEFPAACLAGVFELEAALELVYQRGRLMASMPTGSMLAVKCEPAALEGFLSDAVGLAAHNAPGISVVSGPTAAIDEFRKLVEARNLEVRALHTSHAFHSAMMDPILDPFRAAVARAEPRPPRIPIVSSMTGKTLSDLEAVSPEYWAKQLRNPVRFADAATFAADDPARIFLEVGPGVTLMTSVAKLVNVAHRPRKLVETLGHPKAGAAAAADTLLAALGNLWIHGAELDWDAFYGADERRLVRLPTYPYRRRKHWIEPPRPSRSSELAPNTDAEAPEAEQADTAAAGDTVLVRLKGLLEARLGRSLGEDELDLKFLELGFDSLALSQLAAKLRQEFGVQVPVRQLFEALGAPRSLAAHLEKEAPASPKPVAAKPRPAPAARTNGPSTEHAAVAGDAALEARLSRIEGLLEALVRSGVSPTASDAGPAQRLEVTPARAARPGLPPGTAELTASQSEIWVSTRIGGKEANLAYNECRAFLFDGELDERALTAGLAELSVRHEALRQTFSADGQYCVTAKTSSIPLERHDLRGLPDDEAQKQVQALMSAEVGEPFDLARGPLVRGRLIGLADRQQVLILNAHHVVVDGSSWEILIRELAELYSAHHEQRAPRLPAARAFAEYAALEDDYRASGKAAEAERFWLKHLEGQSEDLNLPTDRPRPARRSYRATRLDQQFSPEAAKKIRRAAAKSAVTTQTFLLAAFGILLSRLSRQHDVICGVPTSGQAAVGMESLVGHCVHVLPLRFRLDADASVKEHIANTQRTMLDGLEHQRATFTELLPRLTRARDPSRPALIQASFGMGRSQKRPQFAGVNTALRVVPRVSETFELYVYATENLGGIEVSWSYNEDLFDATTIELWQRCFDALVTEMVEGHLDAKLSAIPLLTRRDRNELLELARGPRVDRGRHVPVHRAFAERSKADPLRTAVIDAEGSHSYRELDQRANQIAHYLRSRGLAKGALVPVCLDRSVDLVATLLGVWRAGHGYIPLDPSYPAARIQMILEDSKSGLVLTSRALSTLLPSEYRAACLDEVEREIRSQPTSAPALDPDPDDTAYVIFTSGSTGRPKGVQISQGAFENFIASMQKEPGFTREDCILALTTVSFDISGLELFLPLATGGRMVIATKDQALDPQKLQRLMIENSVNVLQATPATWQMLFDSSWPGNPKLKVLCGGEAFPRHLAEKFLESCGEVWNVYGPTETTVWSSVKRIVDAAELTIGRPIDNTTLYVLDENRELAPRGVHGELWIGGDGVARGYLGREELTKERFIPSPFEPTERLYRTGDLARVTSGGEFECLGRVDFQVKVRGFRIELGEVETAMLGHSSVKACAVVARELKPGEKILVAYVVPHPGKTPNIDELRAHLAKKLPAYMVPSAYSVLDALPMTPNKKVDRNALPAPAAVASEAVKPEGELEARVFEQWKNILGHSSFGTRDNFHAIGGHSLMAIRLVERINAEFRTEISVNEFFTQPTVEGLSGLLRSLGVHSKASESVPHAPSPPAAVAVGHKGLFCIQAGTPGGVPLFLIHGDNANGLLAPALGSNQEIWGYHHQGSDGERIQFPSVESLARHAHAEWTRIHGGRPCVVSGHSYGALVAYHLAVLREEQQLETPRVIVIDARHPSVLGGRGEPFDPRGVKRRVWALGARRRAQHQIDRALSHLDKGENVPVELRTDYILATYQLSAHRYDPPPWPGNLDIIRSREFAERTPNDGWETCASKISRIVIDGNHRSIVRTPEGIAPIGKWIRGVLDELHQRP